MNRRGDLNNILVRINRPLQKRLKKISVDLNLSQQALLESIIEEGLDKYQRAATDKVVEEERRLKVERLLYAA